MGRRDDFVQLVQTLAISGSTMQLKNRVAIVAEAQGVAEEALPKDLVMATMEFWDWCTARREIPGWLAEHRENEKSRKAAERRWIIRSGPEWGTSDWETWSLLARHRRGGDCEPEDVMARKVWNGIWDEGEGFEWVVLPRTFEQFMAWVRSTDGYQESFISYEREKLKEPQL